MDPIIGGALITGGVSLANALLGGSAARRQARAQRENVELTNKARMELAKYQFDRNREMWQMMADYNTPSEQMKRFKEAGLNPNLMYGMGTPGNVQQYPQYQAPNIDYTGRPDVGAATMSKIGAGAYQGAQQWQQIRMARENIKQAEVQTWLDRETSLSKEAVAGEQAFQARSETQRKEIQLAREKVQLKIDQIKKQFWESGVSPNDATWIRVGINALQQLGLDVSGLWNSMPEKMRNQIKND